MFVRLQDIPERHRDGQVRVMIGCGVALAFVYAAAICFGLYVALGGY